MKEYNLHFQGSISDEQRSYLPNMSGVYLVYRGLWSEKDKLFYCHEIIYIGKAEDIRERHISHERRKGFLSACRTGEIVFYSYAEVPASDLERVEAALIYHTQPALNDYGKESFSYNPTHIVSDGACALLDSDIIVE